MLSHSDVKSIMLLKRDTLREGYRRKRTEQLFSVNRERFLNKPINSFRALENISPKLFLERITNTDISPSLLSTEEL